MSSNILHLMGMDSTKYGGIEKFNVELSKQLSAKGYHSIFVYETKPCSDQFLKDLENTGADCIILSSRGCKLRFCFKFAKMCVRYKFFIMHAHFTPARFYAIPIAHILGVKNIIYTIHSMICDVKNMKFHTRVWYALINKYCRVVAVSKQIETVCNMNWPKICVKNIYLGVPSISINREICRQKLNIDEEMFMIVTVANFNYVKGLDILVKAVNQINKNKSLVGDTLFYIIGQTENDMLELQSLITNLNVEHLFRLVGINNNVALYLSAADLYIQPSRHEGLPLSLMEACSVKLPIVASNVGGIPEIAKSNKNAILFESEDYMSLANAINLLLSDNQKREQFSLESGSIYQSDFSIEKNVKNLIDFYLSVL